MDGFASHLDLIFDFLNFLIFVFRWVQNLDVSSPEVITKICASLGLDGQKLIAEANSDPIKQKLNETTEQAAKAGCYGAPSVRSFPPVVFGWNSLCMRN